ncbi:hypothetical protein KC19_6G169700 [Ceratodon purpureus]|uniref:Uncharacterized protein n=1 Tax=Ceratodon purpureus TaxID=3225 RepID=A0A8T0HHB7_CERPU|nr:hypothetical protein KC19_6G169700 [Ceratodon purpureus]
MTVLTRQTNPEVSKPKRNDTRSSLNTTTHELDNQNAIPDKNHKPISKLMQKIRLFIKSTSEKNHHSNEKNKQTTKKTSAERTTYTPLHLPRIASNLSKLHTLASCATTPSPKPNYLHPCNHAIDHSPDGNEHQSHLHDIVHGFRKIGDWLETQTHTRKANWSDGRSHSDSAQLGSV